MRVGIAGCGNVGLYLCRALTESGHEVLAIDQDETVFARGRLPESVKQVVADACEYSSLRDAGLESCAVVVAATGDDEDNLVISLLAKQEFAVPRVIARVNHPNNHRLFNETWGVDVAVSTPHLIAGLVEEAVSTGRLVRLLELERGRARLVEVTLEQGSAVAGQAVRDVPIPRDMNFVAVVRDGHVIVPRGDTTFHVGDEVLALVTEDSEAEATVVLTARKAQP